MPTWGLITNTDNIYGFLKHYMDTDTVIVLQH